MGYNALQKIQRLNAARYKLADTATIPPLALSRRSYGRQALLFIRDDCTDLQFDLATPSRVSLTDADGKSSSANQIPYNMEKDINRLCLEKAAGRFLESGSREDAFDIYYCYCEIFRPFGSGYQAAGQLLEMLSEHETNASSLLMKHRDHYSHSVYVFLMGLAIYRNSSAVRTAYNSRYNLPAGPAAACHFLQYWGLTALFHDIGYPFEIAHQQMKAYVCQLDKNNNDDFGFAPYVSYKRMDEFSFSPLGDLNQLFARAITERLAPSYLVKVSGQSFYLQHQLEKALADRAIHDIPVAMDYLYMDHAYFSGLVLAKNYLAAHPEITAYEQFAPAVLDSFCAVMMHNSLFKFTLRSILHTKQPLGLDDGQPLAYLLMLADELQCWDRTCYGQNSRSGIFAFDFDMLFEPAESMHWVYYFDETYKDQVTEAKTYGDMHYDGYRKKSGATYAGRSKFADDIAEIIELQDVCAGYQPDIRQPDPSRLVEARLEVKKKKTGLYLSETSYLNIYDFALALNGRYAKAGTADEMKRLFEQELSLEYKLSNIAQAKGFAGQLNAIGCFYTSRPVDYAPVTSFAQLIKMPGHQDDMAKIGRAEHQRWCAEKTAMGWQYGSEYISSPQPGQPAKKDSIQRELIRHHSDLVDYADLPQEEQEKDIAPMEKMLELIKQYDGLTIYRMD